MRLRRLCLTGVTLLASAASAAASERSPRLDAAPQDTARRERRDTAAVKRDSLRPDTTSGARDSLRADSTARSRDTLPRVPAPLDLRLRSRLEAKGERTQNERCTALASFGTSFGCGGQFQPVLDFQFNLLTSGTVGDRIHVDVDYDTQREFDASNNISIYYDGKENSLFRRVEIGNVSFAPPPSRFLTSGIPSGNYGVQALGRIGPMRYSMIAAQQKGNVVQDRVFYIGEQARQSADRLIEDYAIEPRRFFFTVDPLVFGARYPNIDILDNNAMRALAASLPDTVRPSRVFLYRLLIGGQPPNPNGPRFVVHDPPSTALPGPQGQQPYELLRQNVDYYLDPSGLWFALVRPLNLANERLVVAYTLRVNGRDVVIPSVGGTPDLAFVPGREQSANLIWDPQLTPDDIAFRHEIRSVYRIGGGEIRRSTMQVQIVTGTSGDQEKPPGSIFATYLQLFGLAQRTNSAEFDVENRLWPRPTDPNFVAAGGVGGGALGVHLLRDYFLVFPSVQPFARAGLARDPSIPANDTIYRTPNEYIYSAQHPQSLYRIHVKYESEAGSDNGSIALNAVQLRQGSERIQVDGLLLRRNVDYRVDYEIGRVTFTRPDTLFNRPRKVTVRYEENPLFQSIPTTIFGLTTRFESEAGDLNFTAISQTQHTTFTRPPLGYEPASSLVAGVSGAFSWDAWAISRGLSHLLSYRKDSVGPSRIAIQGEFAVSRPQLGVKQQAFLESFEGEGGLTLNLSDANWYYSSQPALGSAIQRKFGGDPFDVTHASTMAWQNIGTDRNERPVTFTIQQIDPQAALVGGAFSGPEPMLWLTLYPLAVGGRWNETTKRYDWTLPSGSTNAPRGRRWRSIRTPLGLSNSGADLTRIETIEFWTLIDTSATRRANSPTLVIDLGDLSENSIAFSPETLTVSAAQTLDSTFTGKKRQGFDRLDSERDSFSRAFDVVRDDNGIAGDVADTLIVRDGAPPSLQTKVPICSHGDLRIRPLGDSQANCTVRNSRLDEEDLDLDGVLNLTGAQREQERLRRYVVDLSQRGAIDRVGQCGVVVLDINNALSQPGAQCWVHVRVPFSTPDDSTNAGPLLRKVRALRISVVSGPGATDDAFTSLPVARLQLVGAPWVKRTERPAHGIGGIDEAGMGFVLASVVGTQDSTANLPYTPPPGVTNEPETVQQQLGTTRVQVNEHSLRLVAGGLQRYDRAEAYFRFPEGERSFMTYREMRLWARGRGHGWGSAGELEFYVKIGRDANNFYLYRTTANAGDGRSAWDPEIRLRFDQFYTLRAKLQNAYLGRGADSVSCSGLDSALIVHSGLPLGTPTHRFAACDNGYMVYTIDPTTSPPNLAAVQEMAVGIVRIDSLRGAAPLAPGDTMEVWVDDIRLADAVSEAGFAGQISATLQAGDLGTFSINLTRRDPNFRQLGEQPTFLTSNDLEIAASWRLDRLLPARLGIAIPFTIIHTAAGADPLFISRSDIPGDGIDGLRTPKTSLTTYAITIRRATPLLGPWYAPIVNHLAASGAFTSQGNRSEFQTGVARRFSFGLDFASEKPLYEPGSGRRETGDEASLPPPVSRVPSPVSRALAAITTFRLYSALAGDDDRRAAYLKPAAAADDPGRAVRGLSRLWRTGSVIEFRPSPVLSFRWDASSLRDLRDYGDTTPNALTVRDETGRLAGVNTGFEREREMRTGLTIAPRVTDWLVPRLDFLSTSSMLRDPNAPPVLLDNGTVAPSIPRRLASAQTVTALVTFNPARAARRWTGDSTRAARLARVIQPIDVTVTRGLLGAFDATSASPGFGWQFGLGDVSAFRHVGAAPATSSGASTQITLANTLLFPLGASLTNRVQRVMTKNWTNLTTGGQSLIDGDQVVFPDLALQWIAKPGFLGAVVSNLAANARVAVTRQRSLVPGLDDFSLDERRVTRVWNWPLSGTVVWRPGSIATTAGYTLIKRVDSLPGSVGTTNATDRSAEASKAFDLPASWGLKSGLRTRVAFQDAHTESFVSNLLAAGLRSRLTDNGRQSFTLSAATDVADNMTFSLQGSRVVNFDRNFNRKLVQTVFSAALQLQFFAGAMR